MHCGEYKQRQKGGLKKQQVPLIYLPQFNNTLTSLSMHYIFQTLTSIQDHIICILFLSPKGTITNIQLISKHSQNAIQFL